MRIICLRVFFLLFFILTYSSLKFSHSCLMLFFSPFSFFIINLNLPLYHSLINDLLWESHSTIIVELISEEPYSFKVLQFGIRAENSQLTWGKHIDEIPPYITTLNPCFIVNFEKIFNHFAVLCRF
jgi:hypothetical protein